MSAYRAGFLNILSIPGPAGGIGDTGEVGPGVPVGGTARQLIAKVDSTDFNTEWIDPIPYAWTYADSAARLAAAGFLADDVGRIALQADNSSHWVLTSTAPTWVSASGAQAISSNPAATGAITLDCRNADVFALTLISNVTLDLSNGVDGQITIARCTQDATGLRLLTLGASIRVGTDLATATLSTQPAKTDYLGFRYNAAIAKFDLVGFVKGY